MAEKPSGRPKIKTQFHCAGCDRYLDKREFYLNKNKYYQEYNDGRHHYCIKCCKEISQRIMADYGSFEMGLRNVCTFFCIPVVEEAVIKLKEIWDNESKERDWNWVYQYGTVLKDLGYNEEDKWNNLTGNSLMFDETYKKLNDDELNIIIEIERIWGKRTLEQYEFLESRWQKYTDGVKLTTAQASLYRQLCICELEIRDKQNKKEPTKEERKTLGELMSKLGIDKFVSNDKSTEQKMFESQIEYIESTEPAEHYKDLEKFKDYRGIGKYFEDNVKRPFRNLLLNSKDYKVLDEFVEGKKTRKKK